MARREVAALGFDPAPGDVGAVASAARGVDGAGRVFNDASANVGQLDSSGWTGAAGDAFRGQLKDLPRDLDMAARSHRSTAQALTEYGAGLQSRQRRADELESRAEELRRQQAAALAEVNRIAARRVPAGSRELASMRSQYDSARSTAESLGTELQQVVADARRLRDEHESAAGSAATRIRAVTAAPYREPGRLSRALSAVKRWISDHAEVLTEISTVLKGVSAVLGVLSLVPGLQFLAPFAIAAGGAALALDAAVKAVTGKGSWASIGLDASLTFMPWGRAAALVRRVRGTSRALDATGRLVGGARGRLRSAAANPRQTAVPVERRAYVGDPVDVATGDVVLDQVDVELPGLLPLVLRRVHVSSYRAGRLFGRSWASTLDQRLEVDDEGICLAGDDGTVLVYPPPAAGPVLPEDGPPLPLARTDGGGYTLTDPLSGRTRLFTGGAQPGVLPLTAVTDRNGHRIEIDRDVDGAPVEVRHSGGYRIAVETLAGRVRSLRLLDPAGGTDTVLLRFKFAGGDLVEVVNSSGLPLRFAYDDEGRLIRWEDRNRTWYAYEYDDLGRCVRTSGSGGFLAGAFSYDSDRMVTVATDSLGHRRAFHLNEALQVVREVDPLGHMTVSDWDRSDRLLSRTDPLGRTTRYDYGPDGELVRVVRPDGGETAVTPGGPGEPATLVEPDGAVWEREHDENGNLVAVTDPTGATTRYAYDDRGRLTAIIDALGQVRHVETDPAGLPLATADPAGAVTRFQRDAFGRVVAATDPLGQTIRLQWTVEGKLVARTLPDGTTERWDYDGEGNLVEYVDPLGQVTRATVTGFGLPSARTGPDGARLEFAYDTELRLVAVTDPRGLVWRYDYDPAGRLISETDFNGRVLRYRYDAAGQLVTRSNGAGERIRYRRDLLGRVSEQRSTDAVMTFERDRVGRLVRATGPDAEVTSVHDRLGRVVAETCNGLTVRSRYDALGRRVWRRTPSGADSVWEYGRQDQPISFTAGDWAVHFEHDPAGREVERRLGPELALAQSWDAASRLLAQRLTVPGASMKRTYRYRPDGYPVGLAFEGRLDRRPDLDPAGLGVDRWLDLDPVGRVTAVHTGRSTERYAYDPAGAVVSAQGVDGADGAGGADGERRYSGTLIRSAGPIRYEHDSQGRIVVRQQKHPDGKPSAWRYQWDTLDRLAGVVTPDGTCWRYRYDPLGRRIAKVRLGGNGKPVEQVDFTWDGGVLAEQRSSAGSTIWDWLPGALQPLAQRERPIPGASQAEVDERFYAIVTDLVGTPTELVEPSGRIAWTARSTLWGRTTTAGSTDCPLRFPGQYADDETGLHYNHFRFYDPATARYASADPLGLDGGPDPHAYVPNPTAWIDPLGLAPCVPHAFRTMQEFDRFGSRLHHALDAAGHPDVIALLQGSAVTGRSFRTGVPFDVGRVSDLDVALASQTLMGRVEGLGLRLRSGGMRSGPLRPSHLDGLGLSDAVTDLSLLAGRPVAFMIYRSAQAAAARRPSILIP